MKRPPGRPPLTDGERAVPVTLALPAKLFDDLARRALQEDVSIPVIIRRELQEKKTNK